MLMVILQVKAHNSAVLEKLTQRTLRNIFSRIIKQRISMRDQSDSKGFTLMELVVVILIIAIVSGMVLFRSGSFGYLQQESTIRKISETITFLHHQAVADQIFYRMEFDIDKGQYQIGALRPTNEMVSNLPNLALDVGPLSLELSAFLNPALGRTYTMVPPPSIPSLAEPVLLPDGLIIEDIRGMNGKKVHGKGERAHIIFSPKGFSEFSVIHLQLKSGKEVTILVNPFSGITEISREYKDFQWTYGKNNKSKDNG